jgi:hypothetical protein
MGCVSFLRAPLRPVHGHYAGWTFFSQFISSAQRQPNGNTLICEGANGRIFEVTPGGEIVWEYVNPFANERGRIRTNQVFRAAKVSESWLNPT